MQTKLQIAGLEVNIIKKEIKHLHLNILPPKGKIRVSVPNNVDNETIRLFVISKLPQIKKQIKIFQEQQRETKREYISGESHYFQGNRYMLNVIYHDSNPKIVLKNKKQIDFYIKKGLSREQREKHFLKWYREELELLLNKIIPKWEKIINIKLNESKIKIMKTKWGTCNHKDKRIWINLELIKKPIIHLEYIIVHELVHLIEETHSERFIQYMNNFMPLWKLHKQELNKLSLSYQDWDE